MDLQFDNFQAQSLSRNLDGKRFHSKIVDTSLRQSLMEILKADKAEEADIQELLENLAQKHGDVVFSAWVHLLTQLEFSDREARDIWIGTLRHKSEMEKQMNRPIYFVTALCDYLMIIKKSFHQPKMVELELFEETTHSSRCDAMTGLYNRGYFAEALAREANRSLRYESAFSLVFFDLDDFKKINDAHGHLAGDRILKEVAELIQNEKRAEDIAARFGGEEIVLILPETQKTYAHLKAERIRRLIEETVFDHDGKKIRITVSAGVAAFPMDTDILDELLECVDRALYRAKNQGKNRVCLFSLDKRHSIRQEYLSLIKVHRLGSRVRENPLYGKLKDLSMTGILYEGLDPIATGIRVQIEVPFPSTENPLILLGQVARVTSIEESYLIGIAFLPMQKRERDEMNHFFATALNPQPHAY